MGRQITNGDSGLLSRTIINEQINTWYNVKQYGAMGDGIYLHDISMSNGSAVVTSASASFTSDDIGKVFKVFRGVASSGGLITTILSVQSPTQVTLNATNSSGSNITNGRALYGTDDQEAIQDAINACDDGGGGTVFFPNGNYIVAGAPQSTITYNAVSYNANCVLFIPYKAFSNYDRTHILIKGETRPNYTASSYANNTGAKPYFNGGVHIISTYKGTGVSSENALFGWLHSGSNFSYNFASFEDLSIIVDAGLSNNGPGIGGINGLYAPSVIANFILVGVDEMVYETVLPTNLMSGISTTLYNSESMNQLHSCFSYGFNYGFKVGEHTHMDHCQAFGCGNGFALIEGFHGISAGRIMTVACINQISVLSAVANKCNFRFLYLAVEAITAAGGPTGRWYEYVNGLADGSNRGAGVFNYTVIECNVGKNNSLWNKAGGTGVTAIEI